MGVVNMKKEYRERIKAMERLQHLIEELGNKPSYAILDVQHNPFYDKAEAKLDQAHEYLDKAIWREERLLDKLIAEERNSR